MLRYFLLAIVFFSCQDRPDPLQELSWLTGEWQQVNAKGDKISLETWSMAENELVGAGYTINRNPPYDTLFGEQLKIRVEEGTTYYIASVPGQDETHFKLTISTNQEWSFTNPNHDYPKILTYKKTADGFLAEVGDLKKTNQLKFQRIVR